jgi:hypothetical protein
VATMDSRGPRAQFGLKPSSPDPHDQKGAIVEFFGQLWLIPDASPQLLQLGFGQEKRPAQPWSGSPRKSGLVAISPLKIAIEWGKGCG